MVSYQASPFPSFCQVREIWEASVRLGAGTEKTGWSFLQQVKIETGLTLLT